MCIKRSAELRYSGQAYELTVPVAPGDALGTVEARFHDEHRKTYGHSSPGDPVDVVSVRTWAQAVAPDARVLYVDNDPIVLAHARALLTSSPEGETAYLDADLRDTGEVLAGAARLLDLSRPVGVMLVAVLHMLRDEGRSSRQLETLFVERLGHQVSVPEEQQPSWFSAAGAGVGHARCRRDEARANRRRYRA